MAKYTGDVIRIPTGNIKAYGEIWGWQTFILDGYNSDVIQWCRDNLGRRHRGIYLSGFGVWLGNGGRWRYNGRSEYEVGVVRPYTRIWLKHESDIALFKLRWG